ESGRVGAVPGEVEQQGYRSSAGHGVGDRAHQPPRTGEPVRDHHAGPPRVRCRRAGAYLGHRHAVDGDLPHGEAGVRADQHRRAERGGHRREHGEQDGRAGARRVVRRGGRHAGTLPPRTAPVIARERLWRGRRTLVPMAIPLPTPGAVVGLTRSALDQALGSAASFAAVPARAFAVLDGVEALLARINGVVDRIETTLDRTAVVVTEAEKVAHLAGTVVTEAEAVAGSAAVTVGTAAQAATTAAELLAAYE